ncbi:universal stress protein [Streptomyces sp. NPDC052040]|uniref:universal stress protein n=1 Tax=Streptomyces sp. NPDC052040 TaxID=3365682 RepID=UPI0037D17AF6
MDGSDSCLLAVGWAVDEAARHGVSLRLVYASLWARYEAGLPSVDPGRPSEQVLAEHIVASAADRAERHNPDVKVTTDIVPEDAVAALVRAGDEAFSLVTGSRGRGELKGLLLGSVGLGVSARARCPVVVVRGDRVGLAQACLRQERRPVAARRTGGHVRGARLRCDRCSSQGGERRASACPDPPGGP